MKQTKKQKSSFKVRAGSLKRKSDKPLVRLIRGKKRERAQLKMRNEKEVITSTTETQRTINHYYEQLFADKMGIIEEKNNFPGMHNLQD